MAVKSLTINHYGLAETAQAKVGMDIMIGDTYFGLCEGTDYSDSGFAGCEFYAESRSGLITLAVNISLSGRTIQRPTGFYGRRAIRCRIEFVGDCEPSTFTSGWLFLE